MPAISVLLCTVRPDAAYTEHPEWTCLGKVVEDLEVQSFKDFELIIVDGLHGHREAPAASFPIKHIAPRPTLGVLNKKVSIPCYRNSGLIVAEGELVVNLDDCCELPPDYLSTFWRAWRKHETCISPLWRESGDTRPAGPVREIVVNGERRPHPMIYGFGSYPLETAIYVNGYDMSYSLSQGLEDGDWSTRLHQAGVRQALIPITGFRIHAQSAWDPRAVDVEEPLAGCCNRAWQWNRVRNHTVKANTYWPKEAIRFLQGGPCLLLNGDDTCQHHGLPCAYLGRGFVREESPIAQKLYDAPPVLNLREERKKVHG